MPNTHFITSDIFSAAIAIVCVTVDVISSGSTKAVVNADGDERKLFSLE
jgi:hypothetical protein